MRGDLALPRAAAVIGRDVEFDTLRTAMHAALVGRSTCVFVQGEGGIGKTRLLTESWAAADGFGLAVLSGRAPITTPAPFSVVSDALRSWLRTHPVTESMAPFDRGLALVLPEWPVDAPTGDLEAGQRHLLALEAVVLLLRTIVAAKGGAVLLVDDLHGADPESIEVVRYVVTARIEGLTVVGALRPGESREADDLVGRLRRDGIAELMNVGPLDERAVGDLIAALLETSPPSPLVADILARTDGVPLLVEEVLRGHLVTGTVAIDDDGARWHGGVARVPPTIRDLVEARLVELTPAERAVIVAAAVLGDFDPRLLRTVSDTDDEVVASALTGGVRAGLLDTSGAVIAFRHAIIREAVLDGSVPPVIETMHRRAAVALDDGHRLDADVLERRAHHNAAIGADDDAATSLIAAAELRRQGHALLAAERSAQAARARSKTPDVRAAAADVLARVLAAQGRWLEAFELDVATAEEYGDTAERRLRRALSALDGGRPEAAESIITVALELDEESPELALVAGRAALVRGDADEALRRAQRVLDDTDNEIDARLAALDLQGRAYEVRGDRDLARGSWKQQAKEGERAGRTQAELRAVVQLGKLELFLGEPPQRLREAVDLAERAGSLVELAWAEENLAIAIAISGDLPAAIEILDGAINRFRPLQLDQLAYLLASRAMTRSYVEAGAEAELDEADAIAPSPDLLMQTSNMRGAIAMRACDFDEALRWYERSIDLGRDMPGVVPLTAICWMPIALLAAGRRGEAVSALEQARAMPDLDRFFSRPVVLAVAEALLAGDPAGVDAALARVPDSMKSDAAELRVASAAIIQGPARARWLREALDLYEDFGATREVERVRQALRDAGGRVPRRRRVDTPDHPELAAAGVTSREADVLRLIGQGLPNADIASQLYVSVRTVEAHVSSLLKKLAVRNRSELAVRSAAIFGSPA